MTTKTYHRSETLLTSSIPDLKRDTMILIDINELLNIRSTNRRGGSTGELTTGILICERCLTDTWR